MSAVVLDLKDKACAFVCVRREESETEKQEAEFQGDSDSRRAGGRTCRDRQMHRRKEEWEERSGRILGVGGFAMVGKAVGMLAIPRMSSRAKSPVKDDPDVYLVRGEMAGKGQLVMIAIHRTPACLRTGWW